MSYLAQNHFENADYKGPVDIFGTTDIDELLALLDAPRDGEHLGAISFTVERDLENFPFIAPSLVLTLAVDKISREMKRDNVVEHLNPSWYRDNNHLDIVSGMGKLLLPPSELVEPGVMSTSDSKGFVDSAAMFQSRLPFLGNNTGLIVVQLPLFVRTT